MRYEDVVFEGRVYRRYPDHKLRQHRVYYRALGDRAGSETLHRAVWRAAFGAIPKGCHVHHVDGDPLNNALENLALVPASSHARDHWRERVSRTLHCAVY